MPARISACKVGSSFRFVNGRPRLKRQRLDAEGPRSRLSMQWRGFEIGDRKQISSDFARCVLDLLDEADEADGAVSGLLVLLLRRLPCLGTILSRVRASGKPGPVMLDTT
jgi:hypothetical protein